MIHRIRVIIIIPVNKRRITNDDNKDDNIKNLNIVEFNYNYKMRMVQE